jgi:hypothetical protein
MKRIIGILILILLFKGCNLLSVSNISNGFKWKNKKFKEDVLVGFSFNPFVNIGFIKKTFCFSWR